MVTTDRAPVYPRILDELAPGRPAHDEAIREQHDRSRSWPAQSQAPPHAWTQDFRSARILATGHAFIQNLRRGHYDIATDAPAHHRLPEAFVELALAI